MSSQTQKPEEVARDRRLTLAFLWTWALFNYVYGDILFIFTIFTRPDVQLQLDAGAIGGMPLNDGTTLLMAAMMELSIVMPFLAWKLPFRINRIVNIAVALLFTLIMAGILCGSGRLPPLSGYTLLGLIEIASTLAIAWLAWRWRDSAV
jgi:hypothetical protein